MTRLKTEREKEGDKKIDVDGWTERGGVLLCFRVTLTMQLCVDLLSMGTIHHCKI